MGENTRQKKEKPVKLRLFGDSVHNHAFFVAIGQLMIHWANNESLFLRILVSLMQGDERAARVVFYSHKNTLGRLDLIAALFQTKVNNSALKTDLDALIRNFKNLGRKRNFYAHCMYSYEGDPPALSRASGIVFDNQSQSFRTEEVRMEAQAIREIDDTNMKFIELNQRLWSFVKKLDDYLAGQPQGPQESPDA